MKSFISSEQQELATERELTSFCPFDATFCRNASLDNLDEEKIACFLVLARRGRNFPLAGDTPPYEVLEHLNLLDKGRPTNAAMLLFGKQPESQLESQPESRATAPVAPPVAVVVLLRLIGSTGPLGNSEILANFDLSDLTHLRERYIDPSLADGLVERTIPEKPTRRFQKYRLTEKGRRLLKQWEKEGDPS